MTDETQRARFDPTAEDGDGSSKLEEGVALCLSGGGYRAMLFHCGTLLRLNEMGALKGLKRVSSVSGGSLTAGLLGLRWSELGFSEGVAEHLRVRVVDPILEFSRRTIDISAVVTGLALPFVSVADRVESAYRELFGTSTLQDLPDDSGPRFIINATNMQSGVLFRFSRPYAGDYRIGRIKNPTISVARAVAASSAFPPFLSPVILKPRGVEWLQGDQRYANLRARIVLSDGGVYDNLGLETAFKRYKTLIVSDGGQGMAPEKAPGEDWARHSKRAFELVDNQVRSLRKRILIEAFRSKERSGAYFGMRSDPSEFPVTPIASIDAARARQLADTPTRLASLDPLYARRLVNYGYAISDIAYRSWLNPSQKAPTTLPYPDEGI